MKDDVNNAGQQSDAPMQALLQSIYDAILIADLDGKIQIVNPRAEKLFDMDAGTLCSRSVLDIISGLNEGVLRKITQSHEDKRHVIIEALCIRSDEATFPAEIAVSRIFLASGPQLCFSLRDISVRNEAQRKLREAQGELVETEKIKARIDTITTLAHEINNPLQVLLGMVEADRNVRYAKPLNRITAVMQELRLDTELETASYTGDIKKYIMPGDDVERSATDHVLIVDDEETLTRYFSAVLIEHFQDMNVDCAANGAEALTQFQTQHHAVIIMDISMPVMDGEQAFNRIRRLCKQNKWEMPAVIFCSGFSVPPAIAKVIDEEPLFCYLAKPVTGDSLIATVRNRLEFINLVHGQE